MNTEEIAQFLFQLLDDIDTADDMAKADNAGYRKLVRKIQRRRFEVAETDGYTVTWKADPNASASPPPGDDEYGLAKDYEQMADQLPPGWKL